MRYTGEESQDSHRAQRRYDWHDTTATPKPGMTATQETYEKQRAMAADGDSQSLPLLFIQGKTPKRKNKETKPGKQQSEKR